MRPCPPYPEVPDAPCPAPLLPDRTPAAAAGSASWPPSRPGLRPRGEDRLHERLEAADRAAGPAAEVRNIVRVVGQPSFIEATSARRSIRS